jgi:hypothetical protein
MASYQEPVTRHPGRCDHAAEFWPAIAADPDERSISRGKTSRSAGPRSRALAAPAAHLHLRHTTRAGDENHVGHTPITESIT